MTAAAMRSSWKNVGLLRVAIKMLVGDRAKYAGLLFGITFTSFLVTFAASYFAGFMTQGFALIAENPEADIWVMDPAVTSVEQTINMPDSALDRVRSVDGVLYAFPMALGTTEARFSGGHFQSLQIIGVNDANLLGLPRLTKGSLPALLREDDSAVIDPGGTTGKLETPRLAADQWPYGAPHLDAPTRELSKGDELLVNDHRVRLVGRSEALPRFPPRPLLYMTFSNAARILPKERNRLTFVLGKAAPGVNPRLLARRIEARTGLRARAAADFKSDTVRWFLINSEDVGDIATMLTIAMTVGFGVTGVMLYMFTRENMWQYAVLKAMGVTPKLLLAMIFVQSGMCALLGTGLGLGLCGLIGQFVAMTGYPFRMMWFTPVLGCLTVVLISATAAAISIRPVLKLDPAVVFAGR